MRPASRAAASSASSCSRVGRGSRAPRSMLRSRPSSVRIWSSDSRPSSSIRENRARHWRVVLAGRGEFDHLLQPGAHSKIEVGSEPLAIDLDRQCRGRLALLAQLLGASIELARRALARRARSAPRPRPRGTAARERHHRRDAGAPWTTDSLAPTNASPATTPPSPTRARPRVATVDRVDDQQRHGHRDDQPELIERRDPTDDAAGRECQGGGNGWRPPQDREHERPGAATARSSSHAGR